MGAFEWFRNSWGSAFSYLVEAVRIALYRRMACSGSPRFAWPPAPFGRGSNSHRLHTKKGRLYRVSIPAKDVRKYYQKMS